MWGEKKVPGAQIAVSSKQCDSKKKRALSNFAQRERARKGTDKVLQGRGSATQATNGNSLVKNFLNSTENILVSPFRCPTKKQEARERLRYVGSGIQGAFSGVGNMLGSGFKGLSDGVKNITAGGRPATG